MTTILVTGATGTLGRPTTALLRDAGHDVRALSRQRGPELVTGDLLSGVGIAEAVDGVETVLHLATGRDRRDVTVARTLLDAAGKAGVAHLVLISIVGIEGIPLGYYRDKVVIERLVAESAVPHTTLRATQFHTLVDEFFQAQRFLPFLLAPSFSLQPIAPGEVAERLVALAARAPAGPVPDIGGPEQRTGRDLARAWARATGSRRPVLPLRLPGGAFAGYAEGNALAAGPAYGRGTFEEYLDANRGTAA